jgi:outer membrane immunogenic protein
MRKTLLLTATALVLTTGSVFAADVDMGTAPPEEPDWAGLYIGAHAGYGWGDREGCFDVEDCDDPDEKFDYDQKGWLAGGQIGYNFGFASPFVLGLEVDASLAGIDGELELDNDKIGIGEYEWLASAKVRAGWGFDNFLLYATGGLALAGFDYEDEFGCQFDQTRDGWLAGGGVEFKVSPRASLKAEYNFMDLGDEDAVCTGPLAIVPVHSSADAELHVVKFGFNYLLGEP